MSETTSKKSSGFTNVFISGWFIASVVTAFAAIISLAQISSYRADKHHLNGFYTVAFIVLTVVAIVLMAIAFKKSGTPRATMVK